MYRTKAQVDARNVMVADRQAGEPSLRIDDAGRRHVADLTNVQLPHLDVDVFRAFSRSASRRRRPPVRASDFLGCLPLQVPGLAAERASHFNALAKMGLQVVAADEHVGMRVTLVVHCPRRCRDGGIRRGRQGEACRLRRRSNSRQW